MLMDPFNQNPTEIFASQKREKEWNTVEAPKGVFASRSDPDPKIFEQCPQDAAKVLQVTSWL